MKKSITPGWNSNEARRLAAYFVSVGITFKKGEVDLSGKTKKFKRKFYENPNWDFSSDIKAYIGEDISNNDMSLSKDVPLLGTWKGDFMIGMPYLKDSAYPEMGFDTKRSKRISVEYSLYGVWQDTRYKLKILLKGDEDAKLWYYLRILNAAGMDNVELATRRKELIDGRPLEVQKSAEESLAKENAWYKTSDGYGSSEPTRF